MTARRTQPDRPPPSQWDDWGEEAYYIEEPYIEGPASGRTGAVTATLVVLALTVLAVTAFFLVRLLMPNAPDLLPGLDSQTPAPTGVVGPIPGPVSTLASPLPGQAALAVSPQEGYINTLVNVTGQGWWPGEPVFIFLRSPEEEPGRGFSYAASVADDGGLIRTAFTFPNESRWMNQAWAEVIARGTRSEMVATARFTLVPPTPTNTVPVPTLPPVTPTDTPAPTDTPTQTPTPTPTELVITDWQGEYYANPVLAGTPALIRNDVEVNFVWGPGAPAPGVPADSFSVRWIRTREFREGTFRFTVTVDDGVRVWVDNKLLIDQWHPSGAVTYSADVPLARGLHTLRIEYFEETGAALIQFDWERVPDATATPTPTGTPTPTATPDPTATTAPTEGPPPAADDWVAVYFDNPFLDGKRTVRRHEPGPDLNLDWGAGSPDPEIPPDGFSARFTQERRLAAGSYRLNVDSDDGARVWINGQLVIDAWFPYPVQISKEFYFAEAVYNLRIEYFDALGDAHIRVWIEPAG